MLEFFYALIIAPLRAAMELVLTQAYALTDSYGWSIVIMSICVNIALIPVYHLAESWQEDERALQNKMAARAADIKAIYKGREQYMIMRGLYRIYGYHPMLALRTSLGLLIQIPFFFAAYNLLHANPALQGVSFFFINDLGIADALIKVGAHSINLLPFVMTAVNLLSASVYSTRLAKRDKIQLYGLAALFLFLLYTASAGLLLYWTCNNVISCIKNIIYKRYVYSDSTHGTPAAVLLIKRAIAFASARVAAILQKLPGKADLVLMLMAVAAFVVAETVFRKQTVFSLMLFSTVASVIAAFKRGQVLRSQPNEFKNTVYLALITGLFVFAAIWSMTAEKKLNTAEWWRYSRLYAVNFGFITAWLCMRQPFQPLFAAIGKAGQKLTANGAFAIYISAAAVIGVLIFIYTPANLFASDPEFFTEAAGALFGNLCFRLLVVLCVLWFAFKRAPRIARGALALILLWAAVVMLIYTFIFTGDYGGMDQVFLRNPVALRTRWAMLIDPAVALGAAAFVYFLYKKAQHKTVSGVLQGVGVIVTGIAAFYLFTTQPVHKDIQQHGQLPEYNDRMWSFSKTGQNVFVLMLDGFTGGDLSFILNWEPELAEGLDGFVWYPDTTSPGTGTMLSIPGMLGGERYRAWEINKRVAELNARPNVKKTDLSEEMHKAYSTLPNILSPLNFDVALGDVVYLQPERLAAYVDNIKDMTIAGNSLYSAYAPLWRELKGLPPIPAMKRSGFLAAVGVFQASPWLARPNIYNGGSWMKTQQAMRDSDSEGHAALLDVMPVISNTNPVKANTFKYISVQAKHIPLIDTDTGLPADYTQNPERYAELKARGGLKVAEHYSIQAVTRMIRWMKENGVYDNTLFIVMSDHATGHDASLPKELNEAMAKNRLDSSWDPHPLFMVKPFGAQGPLQTDGRYMAGSDVVPIVCGALGLPQPHNYTNPLTAPDEWFEGRHRTFDSGWSSIRRHQKDRFNIITYDLYGSMFKLENWKERKAD